MNENVIYNKSEEFALRIVRLYKHLVFEKKEFVLSKQLLRSGTSIGANVSEAVYAQTVSDLIIKYSIALKEANESRYWMILLVKGDYVQKENLADLHELLTEIIKILTAIIVKLKEKKKGKKNQN